MLGRVELEGRKELEVRFIEVGTSPLQELDLVRRDLDTPEPC